MRNYKVNSNLIKLNVIVIILEYFGYIK